MASLSLINFAQNAQLGLSILPGVLTGVKGIEDQAAAIHAAGGPKLTGDQKKELVMGTIISSIGIAAQAGEQVPNAWVATASALVDMVVKMFNASGVFKKSTPAVPAAA